MELVKFRFNTSFELQDLQRFIKDLFNDPIVKKNFPPLTSIILPDEQKELNNSEIIRKYQRKIFINILPNSTYKILFTGFILQKICKNTK